MALSPEGLRALLARPELAAPLAAHAAATYPEECCALLFEGPAGPALRLVDNLAGRLHAADPEAFPRGPEEAFVLDVRHIMHAAREGLELAAIIHSHCDLGAYFSAEDIRLATGPDGRPLYPGVGHVVLDVREGVVVGLAVYAWSERTHAFVAL